MYLDAMLSDDIGDESKTSIKFIHIDRQQSADQRCDQSGRNQQFPISQKWRTVSVPVPLNSISG